MPRAVAEHPTSSSLLLLLELLCTHNTRPQRPPESGHRFPSGLAHPDAPIPAPPSLLFLERIIVTRAKSMQIMWAYLIVPGSTSPPMCTRMLYVSKSERETSSRFLQRAEAACARVWPTATLHPYAVVSGVFVFVVCRLISWRDMWRRGRRAAAKIFPRTLPVYVRVRKSMSVPSPTERYLHDELRLRLPLP